MSSGQGSLAGELQANLCSLATEPTLHCGSSLRQPRGKVEKAATDLSLVFGGLQEQRVNQSNGVGLDLLVGAVSTEMEAGDQRTREQDDDACTQLKTHCDQMTTGD